MRMPQKHSAVKCKHSYAQKFNDPRIQLKKYKNPYSVTNITVKLFCGL